MIESAQLRRAVEADGAVTDDWLALLPDDVEVLVRGTATGPDEAALQVANLVLGSIDAVVARAVRLLTTLLRGEGTWTLSGIDVAGAAQQQACDVLLELTFEADDAPDEDFYALYSVCFSVDERRPAPLDAPHPFKVVVEYR
ncbi:hypothetical protein HP550_19555 [Cellulomonas humilata]|uniref:Uncharacterized protein n=1 Tax=Cellulomonas humilata TaxID=144055 RepID=A0A7Y6A468_9CELL|nr:hypothetical protein [Cellulomonas humilata]NUU19451.1 hypothetical protein [Cellulomonas humilata]